ncbi:hypothetical protein Tco_0126772 [Tanacetum coccineum]
MDEEFTTTAYLNVQENLKLPTEDQVILEEPASSTGTLSSLQNHDKDLSFTNQFFVEKPHEEESRKTNAKTEVQSMVLVPIYQDNSSVPPMTTPVIDLTTMQSDSPLPTSTATISTITTTTLPPPPQPQQSTTDPILVKRIGEPSSGMRCHCCSRLAMQAPLRARFKDLPTKSLELDYSNQHLADQEEARKKKRNKRAAPRTPSGSPPSPPPPPPPPAGASGAPSISGASGSSQLPPPPLPPSTAQKLSPTDSLMQDDSIPDEQVHLSDDEDSGIGTADKIIKTSYTSRYRRGKAYESVKAFTRLSFTPVPKLRSITRMLKLSNPALSISKIKAASYPDFGLELLVPEQMWIDDVYTYVISAKYGISHWWFNRQKFYIDRHDSSSHRKDVRTHSGFFVCHNQAYSRFGLPLSEIVLEES